MQELVIPELFRGAWDLMKSRFSTLVGIAALGSIPGWFAQLAEAATAMKFSLFVLPISFPVGMAAYGAGLTVAHAKLFRGKDMGIAQGFSSSLSKLLPLLGVVILQSLAVGLGTCACFIPGVIAFLALFAAVPLVLFDDTPVLESFSQSYNLTKGSWLPIFVVVFVVMLVMVLPLVLVSCIFGVTMGAAASVGEQGMLAASGWPIAIFTLALAPVTVVGAAYFNSLYIVVYRALLRRQGRTDEQVVEVFA